MDAGCMMSTVTDIHMVASRRVAHDHSGAFQLQQQKLRGKLHSLDFHSYISQLLQC